MMTRGRAGRSAADKVWATGLAVAACAGVVGALGVRAASDAAAADAEVPVEPEVTAAAVPVSSGGLTQVQLDAYAEQLRSERAALDAYRDELVSVASGLQAYVDAVSAQSGEVAVVPVTDRSAASGGVKQAKPAAVVVAVRPGKASKPAGSNGSSAPKPKPTPKPVAVAPSSATPAPVQPSVAPVQQAEAPAPAAAAAPPLQEAKAQPAAAPAPAQQPQQQQPQATTKSS